MGRVVDCELCHDGAVLRYVIEGTGDRGRGAVGQDPRPAANCILSAAQRIERNRQANRAEPVRACLQIGRGGQKDDASTLDR
jgi:hypothetical protein